MHVQYEVHDFKPQESLSLQNACWLLSREVHGMKCLLQVSFHDEKLRRYVKVARKSNDILNRLEKTRREMQKDLKAEKEVRKLVLWFF